MSLNVIDKFSLFLLVVELFYFDTASFYHESESYHESDCDALCLLFLLPGISIHPPTCTLTWPAKGHTRAMRRESDFASNRDTRRRTWISFQPNF